MFLVSRIAHCAKEVKQKMKLELLSFSDWNELKQRNCNGMSHKFCESIAFRSDVTAFFSLDSLSLRMGKLIARFLF